MYTQIDLRTVSEFLRDTVNFLNAKLSRDSTQVPPIAGWHNFFKPNRIGTTGSAFPLIFLHQMQVEFPYKTDVLNGLLKAQDANGAWAILSLRDIFSVEGTVWPLLTFILAGDTSHAAVIQKATQWLLSNQQPSGGWGSTADSPPRILLTDITIETLACLSPSPRENIFRAITWLSNHQNKDGSWGCEPKSEGTVFHTAKTVNALIKAGIKQDDPRIQLATSFIVKHWQPDPNNFSQEMYDVYAEPNYSRTIMEHDVDAEVVKTLLNVKPKGVNFKIFTAIKGFLTPYTKEGKLHPDGMEPSEWNIIPRATALKIFLDQMPTSSNGSAFTQDDLLISSDIQINVSKITISVVKMLLFHFRLTQAFLLLSIPVLIIFYVVYEYVIGDISFTDLALSLLVEISGLSISMYIDKNRGKK